MAKTGHPNFVLKYTSPWRGTPHVWSITSSHSGASFTSQLDAIGLLQGVHAVVASFLCPNDTTFLSGWKYYNGQDSAALYEKEYTTGADGAADGFQDTSYGSSYVAGTGSARSGLETCVLLEAPVGLSKTAKPVVLRKFIHAVPAGNTSDQPPLSAPAAAASAGALGNGSLHDSRVLISASGKQGNWVANEYFSNHQMPRRRKKASSGGLSLTDALTLLKDAAQSGVGEA